MSDNLKTRIRAWFLKQYRKYFMTAINEYQVPKDEKLYEMDLITMNIKLAEYKTYKGNKVFIKRDMCIYQSARDLHNVKPKFQAIIDKSLKGN